MLSGGAGYYGRAGCQVATLQDAVRTLTPPWLAASSNTTVEAFSGPPSPLLRGYPGVPGGSCSQGIPNGDVYRRFLWVADQLGKQGFYLMPDFHLVKAFSEDVDMIIYDADRFVEKASLHRPSIVCGDRQEA